VEVEKHQPRRQRGQMHFEPLAEIRCAGDWNFHACRGPDIKTPDNPFFIGKSLLKSRIPGSGYLTPRFCAAWLDTRAGQTARTHEQFPFGACPAAASLALLRNSRLDLPRNSQAARPAPRSKLALPATASTPCSAARPSTHAPQAGKLRPAPQSKARPAPQQQALPAAQPQQQARPAAQPSSKCRTREWT